MFTYWDIRVGRINVYIVLYINESLLLSLDHVIMRGKSVFLIRSAYFSNVCHHTDVWTRIHMNCIDNSETDYDISILETIFENWASNFLVCNPVYCFLLFEVTKIRKRKNKFFSGTNAKKRLNGTAWNLEPKHSATRERPY